MAADHPSRKLIIGYGYLGREIARRWRKQGSEVYGTSRAAMPHPEMERCGIHQIRWDVLAGGEELPAVDTAVYCVGFDRSLGLPIQAIYVDGLVHTLQHLPPAGRLIYISSTGVHGGHQGGWIDESTAPAPCDPAGEACLEAEKQLAAIANERKLDFVILRLAGIYGPGRLIGGTALREQQPIRGEPDLHLNLIHVEDAALAVDAAASRGVPGNHYLIADGRPPTRREFYEHLSALLGTPPPIFDPGRAPRNRGDRRICSRRMLDELRVQLKYLDFRVGLAHSIVADNS